MKTNTVFKQALRHEGAGKVEV